MELPTKDEIVAAREALNERLKAGKWKTEPKVMECWEGACWHTDEIYLGILIGLQIAHARKRDEQESTPISEAVRIARGGDAPVKRRTI